MGAQICPKPLISSPGIPMNQFSDNREIKYCCNIDICIRLLNQSKYFRKQQNISTKIEDQFCKLISNGSISLVDIIKKYCVNTASKYHSRPIDYLQSSYRVQNKHYSQEIQCRGKCETWSLPKGKQLMRQHIL